MQQLAGRALVAATYGYVRPSPNPRRQTKTNKRTPPIATRKHSCHYMQLYTIMQMIRRVSTQGNDDFANKPK